jgi:drug/metabolite transporter (DMT)-like permease
VSQSTPGAEAKPAPPVPSTVGLDVASVAICSLIWGTTWFAITKQFGVVPAPVSIAYRFGLASLLLFAWLLVTRRKVRLTGRQHLSVFAQGFFTFGINYACVYFAEERIVSAVVAVAFAGLAFLNIVLFRVALGQRATRNTWGAAALGLLGVAVLSFSELARAHMDARAWAGLGFALAGVVGAACGNFFAYKSQHQGVEIGANTAWGMAYGAGLVGLYALVTGEPWRFDFSVGYVGSLLYLAVFGSVAAFVLYFGVARRRGYTFASYISAITPLLAMGVSAVFEHAHWGPAAFVGVALVIAGQVLLIRTRKA